MSASGRRGSGSPTDALGAAVAVAGITAYVSALLVTLSGTLAAVYASSDIAMAPYVTELWLRAPAGSRLLMGHAPFYLGLWIFRLLQLLPGHRLSWELAPWVLSLAASVTVGAATSRAVGRVPALLVSAALICASTYLLQLQFAWGIHGLAYVNVMLLGAFLPWLTRERLQPLLLWPVAVALAAVTAAGVATDKIVIVAGLVPFSLAGLPLAWRAFRTGSRQVGGAVVLVVSGAVAGAFVVRAAMRSERLSATAFPIHAAAIGSIPSHLLLLVQSVLSLLNGYLHESAGTAVTPRGALGYACATAAAFLLALAVAEAAALLRWVDVSLRGRRLDLGDDRCAARRVSAVFWSVGAAIVSAVYVATTLALSISTRRYLVTVAYAVIVLGISRGATAGRRIRLLTLLAVATLLGASISGVFERNLSRAQARSPTVAMARAVDRLVARERVPVVYAGYWDSYSIGWLGPRLVRIDPVFTYRARLVVGVGSGAGFGGVIRPHGAAPARRSLLILDSTLDRYDGMSGVALPGLGVPAAHMELDHGRLAAYLFDYDIASRFYRVANAAG